MPHHHLFITQCLLQKIVAVAGDGRQSLGIGFFSGCLLFNPATCFRRIQLLWIHLSDLTIFIMQTHFFFINVIRQTGPAAQLFHHPDGMLFGRHDMQDISRRIDATTLRFVVFHKGSHFNGLCGNVVGRSAERGFRDDSFHLRSAGRHELVTILWVRVVNRMSHTRPVQPDVADAEIIARLQFKRDYISRQDDLLRFVLVKCNCRLAIVHCVDFKTEGVFSREPQIIAPAKLQNILDINSHRIRTDAISCDRGRLVPNRCCGKFARNLCIERRNRSFQYRDHSAADVHRYGLSILEITGQLNHGRHSAQLGPRGDFHIDAFGQVADTYIQSAGFRLRWNFELIGLMIFGRSHRRLVGKFCGSGSGRPASQCGQFGLNRKLFPVWHHNPIREAVDLSKRVSLNISPWSQPSLDRIESGGRDHGQSQQRNSQRNCERHRPEAMARMRNGVREIFLADHAVDLINRCLCQSSTCACAMLVVNQLHDPQQLIA